MSFWSGSFTSPLQAIVPPIKVSTEIRPLQYQGFTLIELIVVIVILGILAATAMPKFVNLSDDARLAKLKAVMGAATSGAQLAFANCVIANWEEGPKCSAKARGAMILPDDGITFYGDFHPFIAELLVGAERINEGFSLGDTKYALDEMDYDDDSYRMFFCEFVNGECATPYNLAAIQIPKRQ